MVRFMIIGVVLATAFTLYSLVDAALTDSARARGVSKAVWVVLIVVLPVIGGILWFTIGKGARGENLAAQRRAAPDEDPRFTGTSLSDSELDEHMRELEERLRELDNEVYPGEATEQPDPGVSRASSDAESQSGPSSEPQPRQQPGTGSESGSEDDGTAPGRS